MPARRMGQSKEIKELFYRKIKEKVQQNNEKMNGRIDEELAPWASWLVKPLAGLYHDWQNIKNTSKGDDGEFSAFFKLWLLLPKEWVILNDVVLEPEPDEFAQIDHLLIGPPGVFIIETKAWDGAFTGYRDNWKRKEGNGWVRCSSPTKQNKRHFDLFVKWLEREAVSGLPPELSEWTFPLVVFTKAKWLKVTECSMPAFDGGLDLSIHIRRKREKLLSVVQVDAIANAVSNARPYTTKGTNAVVRGGPIGEVISLDYVKPQLSSGPQNAVQQEVKEPENSFPKNVVKEDSQSANVDGQVKDSPVPNIEQRQTKDGRRYVRVRGSKEEAQEVWLKTESSGEKAGPLKVDRYNKGAWYFYLE